MATNPNWPLTVSQFSTTDPFNAGVGPFWVDISSRVQAFNSSRGRQYELDTVESGESTFSVLDSDEALNPTNPNSPYYPYVLVYRRIIDQAQWPPVPVGGNVNLLNLTTGNPTPIDPTVDSYTTGTLPSWLAAVGPVNPTVQAANPHSGTKSVQYTVTGPASPQGASTTPLSFIPGQQYTASWFVRQSSASVQRISVGGLTALDRFQRTVSNGWGNAETGQAWAISGTAPASEFGVNGLAGTMTNNAVGTTHSMQLPLGWVDFDLVVNVDTDQSAAVGGDLVDFIDARMVDASNLYRLFVRWKTNNTATLLLVVIVAGVSTTIGAETAISGANANSNLWVRFQVIGNLVQAKAWVNGTVEPSAWLLSATNWTINQPGDMRLASFRDTGNTNNPTTFRFYQMSLTGSLPGTTTNVTGSYQRLSVTFTATQPTHTIGLNTVGVTAGTVNLDDIQVEPGGTANTFSSTGPVIYGVFGGFVERWPSSWNFQGTYGKAEITAVDAFTPMANQGLFTEYRNSVLAKNPDYYYPLSEPSGATSFAEASGNNGPPLVLQATPVDPGAATVQGGTSTNIPGDQSGTGVTFAGGDGNLQFPFSGSANRGYVAVGSPVTATPIGSNTATWGVTIACWVTRQTAVEPNIGYVFGWAVGAPTFAEFTVGSPSGGGLGYAPQVLNALNGFGLDPTGTPTYADGKPHLIVATATVGGGNITLTIYVDGVQTITGTSSLVAALGLATPDMRMYRAVVSGDYTQNFATAGQQGTYAHSAAWNRVLSASEITDLWNAGRGYPGEKSDLRIDRYLSYSYVAPSFTEAGASTMGVSALTANTSLLDACQNVTLSENGVLFVDPLNIGTITFQARTHRYLATTPIWVFGENAAGGEIPYLPGITFDYDPTQVYNDVQVTRSGGIIAFGGTRTAVAASQNTYGQRSFQRTVNVASDNETQDAANWIFAGHQSPTQRVASLVIDPASNPSVWPVALGARIGDRATVKRRTSSGYTMSADYFIERIEHSRAAGQWQVTFQMSPAALNRQPWILGDSTYGVLNQTTVLGY